MSPAEGPAAGVGKVVKNEMRQVVTMFTGLVLPPAEPPLGPEDGDALRLHHFALLRRVMDGYDGITVKDLPNGQMVLFTSTLAALSCAVGMQQAVESDNHNQRLELHVDIRVGMSIGEVTFQDGDYAGDSVIEAARLCAWAKGSQILTAASVKVAAGRRQPYRFEPVGALATKDIVEPIEVLALAWDAIPLPGGAGHRA